MTEDNRIRRVTILPQPDGHYRLTIIGPKVGYEIVISREDLVVFGRAMMEAGEQGIGTELEEEQKI